MNQGEEDSIHGFFIVRQTAQNMAVVQQELSDVCPSNGGGAGQGVQNNSSHSFISFFKETLKRGVDSLFMSTKSSSASKADKDDPAKIPSLDVTVKLPCQSPFTRLVIFEIIKLANEDELSPHSRQLSLDEKVKLLKEAGHFNGDFYIFRGRAICRDDDGYNMFTDNIMVYKVYLPQNINNYQVMQIGTELKIFSPINEGSSNLPQTLNPEGMGKQHFGKEASSFIAVNENILIFYNHSTIVMPNFFPKNMEVLDLKTEIKIYSNLKNDSKEKEYIINNSKYTLIDNKFIIGILEIKLESQRPEPKPRGLFLSLKAASAGTRLNTNTSQLQGISTIASFSNCESQSSKPSYGDSVHLVVLLRPPSDKWSADTAIIDVKTIDVGSFTMINLHHMHLFQYGSSRGGMLVLQYLHRIMFFLLHVDESEKIDSFTLCPVEDTTQPNKTAIEYRHKHTGIIEVTDFTYYSKGFNDGILGNLLTEPSLQINVKRPNKKSAGSSDKQPIRVSLRSV